MKLILQLILCSGLIISTTHPVFSQSPVLNIETTSIDTSFLVYINGVEQYLEIKGANTKNPVLLFIHGGPFWPMTPFIRSYNQNLTKDFVVVSWDQRNCGKSKTDTSAKLTLDLFVEDAHQVTQFLQEFLHTPKILVAAHSWGSLIGIKLIKKYPDDYSSYIGMGQMVNMIKSESVAIKHFRQQAEIARDTATLHALDSLSFSAQNGFKNGLDDVFKFNNIVGKYSFSGIDTTKPFPLRQYADYTLDETLQRSLLGADEKTKAIAYKMSSNDLSSDTVFKVPVFFFVGKHDYVTSFQLTQQYFNSVKAPKKELFWFTNSGHAPNWEEPNLFYERLVEISRRIENK